jgi:hypothetical protein
MVSSKKPSSSGRLWAGLRTGGRSRLRITERVVSRNRRSSGLTSPSR